MMTLTTNLIKIVKIITKITLTIFIFEMITNIMIFGDTMNSHDHSFDYHFDQHKLVKVGEAQQMEEGLRRELARVARDIEVISIVIIIIRVARDNEFFSIIIVIMLNIIIIIIRGSLDNHR